MTPEELADSIIGDTQLIDNTWQDARRIADELKVAITKAIRDERTEIERLQILFAYTEGDLPGRLAAKALGADGFEMTLLIEAAVKADEKLVRNGYPLKNDFAPTP